MQGCFVRLEGEAPGFQSGGVNVFLAQQLGLTKNTVQAASQKAEHMEKVAGPKCL